jgi:hypothetical protein
MYIAFLNTTFTKIGKDLKTFLIKLIKILIQTKLYIIRRSVRSKNCRSTYTNTILITGTGRLSDNKKIRMVLLSYIRTKNK